MCRHAPGSRFEQSILSNGMFPNVVLFFFFLVASLAVKMKLYV